MQYLRMELNEGREHYNVSASVGAPSLRIVFFAFICYHFSFTKSKYTYMLILKTCEASSIWRIGNAPFFHELTLSNFAPSNQTSWMDQKCERKIWEFLRKTMPSLDIVCSSRTTLILLIKGTTAQTWNSNGWAAALYPKAFLTSTWMAAVT